MRILNWVQSKLNGKTDKQRPKAELAFVQNSLKQNARMEEFDEWPNQTLLAIGTFGNNKMKEDSSKHESSQNLPDFTSEEVSQIKEEIKKLLGSTQKPKSIELKDSGDCDDKDDDAAKLQKIVLTRVKDLMSDTKNGSRKTSIKFLLKKMFVCHSGFNPTPSLKDPINPESRMETILKAMLHKKIYSQSSGQPATKKYLENQPSVRKFLEKKATERLQLEENKDEISEEASKWVNTDSEYIVLEI